MKMNQTISSLIKYVDDNLRNILMQYSGVIIDELYEGMEYACFGGGKRIRPLLLLSCAESFGLNKEKVVSFALAIELFHSYSLVHDDLPGMDNDLLRRGKPTVHVKFGQGLAILIGDALLNSAFEVLTNSNNVPNSLLCVKYIAEKTGAKGMIGGQAKDILHFSNSLNSTLEVYEGKTSALFQASIVTPALILGLEKNIITTLEQIGSIVGRIFQLNDDIADYLLQSDVSNYVSLAGIEKSNLLINSNREKCNQLLFNLNLHNSKLYYILKYFNIL